MGRGYIYIYIKETVIKFFLPWVYHFTVTVLSPLDDNYACLVLTENIMHRASLYISYILYTQTACMYMQA